MENKQFISKQNPAWRKLCLFLGVLFLAFVFLDFFIPSKGKLSSGLKLFSIVLLFLGQTFWGKKGASYWKGAAGLTVLTDYFLLFTNFYSWGVFSFIWVHLLRLLERRKGKRKKTFLYAGLLGLGLYLGLSLFLPRLLVLSLIYGLFLILNTLEAWSSGNKKLLFAYLLFCGCDLCVALANLQGTGLVRDFSRKLIWIFYLPSQVLLADQIIESREKGQGKT